MRELPTAKEAQDKLEKVCGGDGLATRVSLMMKLVHEASGLQKQ